MVNVEQIIQKSDSSNIAMSILAQRRVSGAEVDSSIRFPPPRCHPDTRKSLRNKITAWFADTKRDWNMFWLLGPAGVGKSAVAQTIAEECQSNGLLGATFFFSRSNGLINPSHLIPTLAHQLAVRIPQYKTLITHILAEDPTILEKDLRSQFKAIITEPFRVLHSQGFLAHPYLVAIDGLDECNGKDTQCLFIELISNYIRSQQNPPLLWLVCSRPESHLKRMLSGNFDIDCHREHLGINSIEGQEDVYTFLCDGFTDIRRRFPNAVDEKWLSEETLVHLARVSSGLFVLASTILKFIGDESYANPVSQLAICLMFFDNALISGTVNPLQALDHIYHQILVDVPPHILPVTMRILCFILLSSHDYGVTPCDISNILGISRATFYAAVQGLHSVLSVPDAKDGDKVVVQFYHASFGDFLRDPKRSDAFHQQQMEARCEVAIQCLHWHSMLISHNCCRKGEACPPASLPFLWVPESVSIPLLVAETREAVSRIVWKACCSSSDDDAPKIIDVLLEYEFCHLYGVAPDHFMEFLRWLYRHDRKGHLLRYRTTSSADTGLLEWAQVKILATKLPSKKEKYNFTFTSQHKESRPFSLKMDFFLLGCEERSCLLGVY
ncbi:hypothetical protein P691DRAFT_805060 [Macrolepiota fuliginosa MF-IS2]|uniref:NACHT domain-containing protein n=1 Tax=Macrolepiota fuliginosa MF-IS2 TaxID=1400762 RepID=A0A9P5XA38_9AGAR|nr:hypothetical protein P691DRAFT_805060 [Macrolepiota fuliginosa MF-IS2]